MNLFGQFSLAFYGTLKFYYSILIYYTNFITVLNYDNNVSPFYYSRYYIIFLDFISFIIFILFYFYYSNLIILNHTIYKYLSPFNLNICLF